MAQLGTLFIAPQWDKNESLNDKTLSLTSF